MRIFYLAHDLDDPAISRRATQLRRGGAWLSIAGFRRRSSSDPLSQDVVAHLGRTVDGRLGQRALAILGAALRLPVWGYAARNCDVLVARGLEMLVLGVLLRRTICRTTPIVYECLDIHRLMTSQGAIGRALRFLEGRLLHDCALLITSSPAFVANHFVPAYGKLPPILLWENRMLSSELQEGTPPRLTENRAPWRIGWFGIIRCERSLELLGDLCRALPGQVEVEIRGRPTRELLPKLQAAIASTPGLTFRGPYERSRDLAEMYGRVHFTWAIDFFEDGANSAWLLPNRLYEGGAHGSVPIALSAVETGRWLGRHALGVLFGSSIENDLQPFFEDLEAQSYRALAGRLSTMDPHTFSQPDTELVDIVAALSRLASEGASHGRREHHDQSA